jgi:diadenosine tetraphosphate (Ap4A) HIT family hydrolase
MLRLHSLDDNANLKEMMRNERQGGHRYDDEFAKNVMKNSKFAMKTIDDLEDVYGLDMWGGKEKHDKRDKRDKKHKSSLHASHAPHKQRDPTADCWFCFENPNIAKVSTFTKRLVLVNVCKHLVVALGNYAYLALPDKEGIQPGHCLIVPNTHVTSLNVADEGLQVEISNFKKCLIMMFAAQDKDVVFMETVTNLKRQTHSHIEVIPIPIDQVDHLSIYFNKALMESGSEWSQHRKIIKTANRRGCVGAIPDGFAYFHVEFSDGTGYAHVIEDEIKWKRTFGREVVAGVMRLDDSWMRPRQLNISQQKEAVVQFVASWKNYDWTLQLQ